MMMSRAFRVRARPISIICCWPTDRSPAMVRGEMFMSSSLRISAVLAYRVLWSTRPPFMGRLPMNRFCATSSCGAMDSSWYTQDTPAAMPSVVELKLTDLPSIR